jgi:hypothetical protein
VERKNRSPRRLYVLCGLVYLGLAIEILGISLTDENLHARTVPTPPLLKFVGYVGLAISSIAPVLAIAAVASAPSSIRRIPSVATKALLWIIVVAGALVSFGEFLWSCSGHPTWYMGFAG